MKIISIARLERVYYNNVVRGREYEKLRGNSRRSRNQSGVDFM